MNDLEYTNSNYLNLILVSYELKRSNLQVAHYVKVCVLEEWEVCSYTMVSKITHVSSKWIKLLNTRWCTHSAMN